MNLQDARKKIPELSGLSDESALNVIHEVYYPTMDKAELAGKLGYKQAAPAVEPRSMPRAVADTAVQFGKGAVTGVRMMSDVFGADNAVSGGLRTVDDALAGLLSATAKQDQAQVAAIMQEAEGKGWMEQIGLGLKAAGVAPGALLAQAAGTAIPTLASAALTGGAGPMAAAARIAAPALMGGAQGVGATKGAIYEEVKQRLKASGATDAEAEARAVDQQSYGGDSSGQLALGGLLGGVAGVFGVERAVAAMRGGVAKAAPGMVARMSTGAVGEAVPEFGQGYQEKYATNSALNNEGYTVDPTSGAMAGGTMEMAAGAGMGAAFGIPRPSGPMAAVTPQQAEADAIRDTELVPESGALTRAVNAGTEAKAKAVESATTAGAAWQAMGIAPATGSLEMQRAGQAYQDMGLQPEGSLSNQRTMASALEIGRQWQDVAPTQPQDELAAQKRMYEAGSQWQRIQEDRDVQAQVDARQRMTGSVSGQFDADLRANIIDQADLASLVETERRDQQVMQAQMAQDRQKQAEVEGTYTAATTTAAVEQAATIDAPNAMQAAFNKLADKTIGPEPEAAPVATKEPRIVARTPDMKPMPLELAELQVDMDGGEVARVKNANGKFGYVVVPKPAAKITAATAKTDTGTQEGDTFNSKGKPFTNFFSANAEASRMGAGYEPIKLRDNAFVVRAIPAKTAETNTPTVEVGGNITTLAEPENQSNQPLAVESIAPVATESVATKPANQLAKVPKLKVTFGGRSYPVDSINEAQDKWVAFRDATDAGVSEIGNGVPITDEDGNLIARVSYNGRAWDSDEDNANLMAEAPTRSSARIGQEPAATLPAPAPVTQPPQPITGEGAGGSQPTQVAAAPADDRIGRDNTPMSEGGKPFKTKRAAMIAKKLQPAMRIAQTEGGYVLKPKTEKQLAAEAKAAKRLGVARAGQAGVPTAAHEFIATEGGMDPITRNEFSMGDNPRVGNRRLFAGARGGMSLEVATEKLIEAGYLPQGASHSDAVALIGRSFTNPQYTATGTETVAEAEIEARFDDYLAEQEDAAQNDDFDPFESAADLDFTISDAKMAGYDAAEDPIKLEVNALLAQADALGIDTSEITEQAYEDTRNGSEQDYYEAARAALAAAVETSNRDSSQDAGQQGNAGSQTEGLTAPTRADVLAQQERTDNAQALDDRAQIDAEASRQTLTQQIAPEQRRDTSGDMFGEEKAVLKSAKKEADAAAKNEAAKDPNQAGMFDAPAEVEAQAEPTEVSHNGTRIYQTKIKLADGAEPSIRWAVESQENKALKADGKRAIGGDSLHSTLPEAKNAADFEAAKYKQDQELKAKLDAESKATQEAEQAKKDANKGKSLSEIKAEQFLAQEIRNSADGAVTTRAEWVKRRLDEGNKPSTQTVDKIKPMSRAAFNRANNQEQAAHEKKIKDGGKVLEYSIGDYVVTKTEYDYAQSLSAAPQAEAAPAWHTKLPDTGVAFNLGDENVDGSRMVIGRMAQEAADAITQVQNLNGGKMYAYVLPSTATEHGALRLLPEDQTPPAPWVSASGEGLRTGFMTGEQLTSKLREILQSQPILTSGDEKAMAAALTNPPKAKKAKLATPAAPGKEPKFSLDPLDWDAGKLSEAYSMGQLNTLYAEVREQFSNATVSGSPVDERGMATAEMLNADGQKMHKALQKAMGTVYEKKKVSNPPAITQADVDAAKRQALTLIEQRIDGMKADAVQKFATKFLPTMGVKVPLGKARVKAAMSDPAINMLAAVDELGVELAPSIKKVLEADNEGRVGQDDAAAFATKKSNAALPPVDESVIHSLISRIDGVRQAAGDARIVLVGSPAELPVKIQEQAKLDGIPENEIHGVLYKGVAYIVRQNLKTEADVYEVLVHEVLGHGGVNAAFGTTKNTVLLESFDRAGGVDGLRNVARRLGVLDELNQRIPGGSLDFRQKIAIVDEMLALAQGKTSKLQQAALQWWNEVRNHIINALNALGFSAIADRLDKFDASEAAVMLRQMREAVIDGGDISGHGVVFMVKTTSVAEAKIKNLVTLHNLTVENLMHAADIGGIPVPSIGITKVDSPFGGFGEITLIAPKGMIDPANGVPVYDRDAYTARYPAMNFKKVSAKKADAFYDRVAKVRELGFDGGWVSQIWEAIKNASTQNPDKVWKLFQGYDAPRLLYATEVLGKTIKIPMRPVSVDFAWAADKQFAKTLASLTDALQNYASSEVGGSPEMMALSNAAREAIGRHVDKAGAQPDPELRNDLMQSVAVSWGDRGDWAISPDKPMPWKALDRIFTSAQNAGKTEVDRGELSKRLDKLVPSTSQAYADWAMGMINPLFDSPTITLRGKQVEPTLQNVVDAMTTGVTAGAETTMTSGPGKIAAMLGKRFKSLAEIQAARDQVVPESVENESKEATSEALSAYRNKALTFYTEKDWRGQIDTWAGNDAAMEALAAAGKIGKGDAAIRMALARKGFLKVDQATVDLAREAIDAIRSTVTNYFEAKPQRAVKLNEFRGAVVPKGTSQAVLDVMAANGIEVATFNPKDPDAKNKALEKLARKVDKINKDVLFSRSAKPTRGLPTTQVTSIIDAIRARWSNAPEIIVVASMDDPLIPQKVRDQDQMQKSQGATGEPEGFVYRGKVYLLASEMATPTDVMRVLFHESLGHLGLRGVFGDKLKPILDQITAMRRGDVIAKARQYGLVRSDANGDPVVDVETATDKEVFAAMDQNHKREAAEEVLAVMAQTKPELGYVKRAIAIIRSWLRANVPGFSNMKMTDAEIITNFILPARRFVEGKGGPKGGVKAPASGNITTQAALSRGKSDQTDTPAFRKWFGDSKVVDAQGKPLVVYHGTKSDFSEFDPLRVGSASDQGWYGSGFYFTPDSQIASEVYANRIGDGTDGANVMPVYLSIKNPYDWRSENTRGLFQNSAGASLEKTAELKARGFDGVVVYDDYLQLGSNEKLTDKQWKMLPESTTSLLTKEMVEKSLSRREWGYSIIANNYGKEFADSLPKTRRVLLEVVAFNPTQIKSATGNNGDFDGTNPDIRFSRSLGATLTDAANNTQEALKNATVTDLLKQFGNRLGDFRGLGLQTLGRRQLVDIYGKDLPAMVAYSDMVAQMEADKNESGAEADGLTTDWGKLKDERQLAELMHDATLAQIDPSKAFVEGDDQNFYDALKDGYDKLTPDAKKAFLASRDMYSAHNEKVRKAIRERITRSELSSSKKQALLERMDGEFFKKVKGVYFPLARFGSYVTIVKDSEGNVVSANRSETMNEAEATRKVLQTQFPTSGGYKVGKVLRDREFNAARDGVGRGFMADLFATLEKTGAGEELMDSISQLYLAALPDLSWAKHGIHRKGTPGFSQDARRAFAQNMFHGARYLAKLRYADQLQTGLDTMQKQIADQVDNEAYDSVKAQQVVDEMVKRHESLMNPASNPLSTALTSIGFVFHLGLSPASALVNLSQTALVALPIMGAKWGFTKSSAALLVASKQAAGNKNDISTVLRGDERTAYDEAVRRGVIDVTMAHDLAGIAQGEDSKVSAAFKPVMKYASFLFHHAEKFNRQVTFVAAYRLAREAGTAHEAAFDDAVKATYDGHFDYGAANRPRLMQGNVARVVFLFKQYSQNMIYTLTRNAQQAIKAETPEGRAEARKALSGLLVSHAMAAGVFGLPVVGMLMSAASAIGGDDDEPWDAKVALKNMLADSLGPKAAEVFAHGLSRLTPWDISGRVGLDRLLLPDVQEGLEGTRAAESWAAQALGPVVGIGINMVKGLSEMGKGEYQRGLESMLPSALRGPMKAYRLETEGNIDKSGVAINENVSVAGVAGQAMGFSPSETRLAQEGKSAIYSADRAIQARRTNLVRQFALASMATDAEGVQDARKDIARFNEKNPKARITQTQLVSSIRARQRRINEAKQGVYLPSKRQDAMEAGRFAVTE